MARATEKKRLVRAHVVAVHGHGLVRGDELLPADQLLRAVQRQLDAARGVGVDVHRAHVVPVLAGGLVGGVHAGATRQNRPSAGRRAT
jgi:hypothetical protein